MSQDATTLPPAGWYGDPQDQANLRYWDGQKWTDQTRPMITEQAPAEIAAEPASYSGPPILIATTNDVPGYQVVQVIGEVFAVTVRARNAFSNMGASFRTMFGGEVKGYTSLLSDSRQEAVDRLKAEAARLGANAVLAMRYDSGEIADLMNEVAAYGTAVRIEPDGSRPVQLSPASGPQSQTTQGIEQGQQPQQPQAQQPQVQQPQQPAQQPQQPQYGGYGGQLGQQGQPQPGQPGSPDQYH